MGRKKRSRRDKTPTSPRAGSPAGPTGSKGVSVVRRKWPFLVGLAVVFLLISSVIVFQWTRTRDRQGSAVESGAPAVTQEQPEPTIDPRSFEIPASFSAERKGMARQARTAHGKALEAYRRTDLDNFLKRTQEAFRFYLQADWIFPKLGQLHYDFLVTRVQRGDQRSVYVEAQRWVDRFPEALKHHEFLGILDYQRGRYAEAAKHFEEYALKRPGSLKTFRQLSEAYAFLGAKEKAVQAMERSLAIVGFPEPTLWMHPDAADTLRKAISVTTRFKEYDRLEEIATALLRKHPRELGALVGLGLAKRYRGDYPPAEALFRTYFQRAPLPRDEDEKSNREQVRFELGLAILKQGRPADALREFVLLLTESPYFTKGYFQVGQCLTRLGRGEFADPMFRVSQKLDPSDKEFRRESRLRGIGENSRAARARAMAFALRGQYLEGERALRGSGKVDNALLVYTAEYLVDTLHVQEARTRLRELTERLGAQHDDVRGWSARADALEGHRARAVSVLADLCGVRKHLTVWGPPLARLLLNELSNPADAVQWLEKILDERPKSDLQVLLGRALFEAGDSERAFEVLEAIPPQDEGVAKEAGGVWISRCRLRLGKDLEKAKSDLKKLEATAAHLEAFQLAKAEWYDTVGDPLEVPTDGETRPRTRTELAEESRAEALRIARLEKEFLESRARAVSAKDGREAARQLLSAANIRRDIGDRKGALRLARLAAARDPESRLVWKTLTEWLDRPDEIFLRNEATRRLAELDSSAPKALSVKEIVGVLVGSG